MRSCTATVVLFPFLASAPAQAASTLEECVAAAVASSGKVGEAKAKVAEWEARLAEVKANWYPKISATAFAAPMFTVRGSPFEPDVERDYGRWGPYLRFDGLLIQPLNTFGRLSAAERAAHQRLLLEEARLEQVRNDVALEVRRFYYLHLYARSLMPTLQSTGTILAEAREKAQEMYASGSGKVTNVDLMKLRYAASELARYRVQAEIGAALALEALKHTMGLPASASLELADQALPEPPGALPPLDDLVKVARERRPEVAQLRHGKEAALALERSEKAASLPILGLAGQLGASWTPTRPDAKNPFHYDIYNDLSGGVALALKFDVDPARDRARAAMARATAQQVDALARYAATGIPMEVRKAYDEAVQASKLLEASSDGSAAARKWMLFAAAAYASGTGETRDLLEGVASHASARKNYFDALLAVHTSRSELLHAMGLGAQPESEWRSLLP